MKDRYFDWSLKDMTNLINTNLINRKDRNCLIGRVNQKVVQNRSIEPSNFDLFKERIVL